MLYAAILTLSFGELARGLVFQNEQRRGLHKPVIFYHIHKGAGSAMCRLALENGETGSGIYGGCITDDRDDHNNLSHIVPCEERLLTQHFFHPSWVAIEREYQDADYCPDNFMYATLLRDPMTRIESEIRYFEGDWGDSDRQLSNLKLSACLFNASETCENSLSPNMLTHFVHLDNFMVRTFGGPEVLKLPPGSLNATHVQMALRTLSKFDLVARVEDLTHPNLQNKFRELFGWQNFSSLTEPTQPWNYHTNPYGNYEWNSQELRASLREVNKHDYALYNAIQAL